MLRFLFVVLAAFAALPCFAQDTSTVERVAIPGLGSVDYQRLFEVTSEPGESLDAFALRIGPRLRAFSDETGFEACGSLAKDDAGRFGVVIGTNRSRIACVNFNSKRPAGFLPTGETIHSHGTTAGFLANRNDITLQGQLLSGKSGLRRVAGQRLDAFSKMDFDGGAGYLATPTGVIHQAGKESTTRNVTANDDLAAL